MADQGARAQLYIVNTVWAHAGQTPADPDDHSAIAQYLHMMNCELRGTTNMPMHMFESQQLTHYILELASIVPLGLAQELASLRSSVISH